MSPQNTQAKNGDYINLGEFQGIAAFPTVDILLPVCASRKAQKNFDTG
jgi:hypothetical protein